MNLRPPLSFPDEAPAIPSPAGSTVRLAGRLPSGSTWIVDAPRAWNGTLLLFGHALVAPGDLNLAYDAPDPVTARTLIRRGYALGGAAYATSGWAFADALSDQIGVIDAVEQHLEHPRRTLAWGASLGGAVSAVLAEREPDRIDGALSMSGFVGGSTRLWDTHLDLLFVLTRLLGPDLDIAIVHGTEPGEDGERLLARLRDAQRTAAGRARIALAASLGGLTARSACPHGTRLLTARQAARIEHLSRLVPLHLLVRADLEARLGGNPTSNIGVDYELLLSRSGCHLEVEALYAAAGLDLAHDLATLDRAPRIHADPAARAALRRYGDPTGRLRGTPVLTLHDSDDPLVGAEHETAYRSRVVNAGYGQDLRQLLTDRVGHASFTPAEMVAALDVLAERVETGRWPRTTAADLAGAATALGPELNAWRGRPTDPAFTDALPGPLLRSGCLARSAAVLPRSSYPTMRYLPATTS